MDLLSLSDQGIEEIVATLGTALTHDHIRRIKGIVKEAVVVFDSDSAGIAAAIKSLPIFLNEGLTAKAVVLPPGHDPDSFVREMGPARFLDEVEKALGIFDFFLDQKLKKETSDVETTVRALNDVLSVLSQVDSQPQKALYIRRISERSDVNEQILWSELDNIQRVSGLGKQSGPLKERISASDKNKKVGDGQLLNLLLHHTDSKSIARLMGSQCQILISEPAVVEIVDAFVKKYLDEGPFPPENLDKSLESEHARMRLREALMERSFYADEEVEQAVEELEQKIHQKKLSDSFKEARKLGDLKRQNELLKKLGKERL
jgi:DNA primase